MTITKPSLLPELYLPSRVNQHWLESGLDSFELCLNREHFLSYPHKIEYHYNSRGFRDAEWPEDMLELKEAVWCIGDSFTVGIGSPAEFTWPQRLSSAINKRTINVSMDGASNEWIARIAQHIISAVNPKKIVIMWSYTHRREHSNMLLDDEHRRTQSIKSTVQEDLDNLLACKKQVDSVTSNAVVNFAIPGAHSGVLSGVTECWNKIRDPSWPVDAPATAAEFMALPSSILLEIKNLHKLQDDIQNTLEFADLVTQHNIMLVQRLDIARDGHHFDKITADWVAQQAVCCLE
jgi:hypothetical protein